MTGNAGRIGGSGAMPGQSLKEMLPFRQFLKIALQPSIDGGWSTISAGKIHDAFPVVSAK